MSIQADNRSADERRLSELSATAKDRSSAWSERVAAANEAYAIAGQRGLDRLHPLDRGITNTFRPLGYEPGIGGVSRFETVIMVPLVPIAAGRASVHGSAPLAPQVLMYGRVGGRGTAGSVPSSAYYDYCQGVDPARLAPAIREGYSRVYRAVSEAEYQDILKTGQFRQGPNSLEGKRFADSLEGAQAHGKALFGEGKFRLIEADVPDNAPSLFRQPNLDGRGSARYLHLDDLNGVTPRPR